MDKVGEALLLTGGASRRMGHSKALLEVGGEPIGRRIVRLISAVGWPVTVLGTGPIEGAEFQGDLEPLAGPLACLRDYRPKADLVFVASCDLFRFDPACLSVFASQMQDHDAVIAVLDGRAQPLCALYRREAFLHLTAAPNLVRVRDWIGRLDVLNLDEGELTTLGLDPASFRSANTVQEYQALMTNQWLSSPIFGVANPRQAAEYYRDVLGFTLDPDDGVFQPVPSEPQGVYALVKRQGVWIHFQIRRHETSKPQRSAIERDAYLYVDSVKALYNDYLASGANIIQSPELAPYGILEMVVEDLNGFRIAFGEMSR